MKIIKQCCLLIIIIGSAFALFMCQPHSESSEKSVALVEETLYWNVSDMPHFLYPRTSLSDSEKNMVNHLYEGLTRVIDGQVVYGMAQNIDIDPSELKYTFTLKSSKWSDGRSIKANDFLKAWERQEHYFEGINLLYFDSYIKAAYTNGMGELIIELFQKNDLLLHQLSHVEFMPVRNGMMPMNELTPNQERVVSNGPYYVSAYRPYDAVSLKKNMHYYDNEAITIESIEVSLDLDYNHLQGQLKKGQVDFSESVDWNNLEQLLVYEPNFKVFEDAGYYGYIFNNQSEALASEKMRELLFEAVEKTALNPFQSIISDSLAPWPSTIVNGQKVNELVELVGYAAVKDLNGLEIVTRDNANDIERALHLAESWRTYLGIESLVVPKSSYDYYLALQNRDYDVILNRRYSGSQRTIDALKQYMFEQELGGSTLIEEWLVKAYIPDVDWSIVFDVDNYVSNYLYLPLFKRYDTVILKDSIQGWSRNDQGLFYFAKGHVQSILGE